LRKRSFISVLVLLTITLSQVTGVSAHTTLGDLNGASPFFRSNDHELNPTNAFGRAHVPGPLGHVWPGGGLNYYLADSTLSPGYQSPFTSFVKPVQAAAATYSPEGAILTSTTQQDNVGDLIFAINFSQPEAFTGNPTFRYNNITMYIPAPVVDKRGELLQDGFEPAGRINWEAGDVSNIVTTITDDYGKIFVTRADMQDPFGPGWWMIRITASGRGIEFTPERGWREWYYIRVNQLRAPDIAGRYFFKIFLGDHYPIRSQSAAPLINSTMPMENWPVLLVKGEVDPAIIYGTVKYGDGSNVGLYGKPLHLPGMVRAIGIADDPYTSTPTSRPVEARGYFNASAQGNFEVEGVAPGLYDLYASAAGFPEQKVAENIKLCRGQSLSLDISLEPGPQICGEVYSKGSLELVPWRSELPVSVVIYDGDNYVEQNVVSFSPINLTHAPYTSYVSGRTIFGSGELSPLNVPKLVAFPWEGPIGYYAYTAAPPFRDPFGLFNGVGPAQVWWVSPTSSIDPVTGLGSNGNSFHFQFGQQAHYGAPSQLSGMVPQVFATWIDGLKPGTYFIRIFINGYVQTDATGTLFQDYYFTVKGDASTSDVTIPIDLRLSSSVNVTVHFHDVPGGLRDSRIGGPDLGRFLVAEMIDMDGSLAAFNFTYVSSTSTSATILLNGLGMAGLIPPPDPRAGTKYSLFRYRGLRDYGLYPSSYSIRLYFRGYIQASPPADTLTDLDQSLDVSLPIGGGVTSASTHMFRGGGINITVYSVDWQKPPVERPWKWDRMTASLLVYDMASGSFMAPISFWDASRYMWSLPMTNSAFTTIPWPRWKAVFGSGSSTLLTNGSVTLESFGPDLPLMTSRFPEQDMASNIFLQSFLHVGFLYSSMFYRGVDYRSSVALYPGFYAVNGWTYGYVQDGVVTLGDPGKCVVSTGMGYVADTNIQLMRGVEFNITVLFRKEGIFTTLPYNMSMRIRIYDDRDLLVAAASTSLDVGAALPAADIGFFADGSKIYSSGGAVPPIPAGTSQVEYRGLAGLFGYTDPSVGAEALRQATLFPADHGVWGSSPYPLGGAYSGSWRVIVELVTWYRPSQFYPPAPALLQGETHLTNLTALLPYNHLGPYELRQPITIPNAPLFAETSVPLALDQRGYLQGVVNAFNMHGELRTASWVTVQAKGQKGSYTMYTWDGFYEMYLPAGTFELTFDEPGYTLQAENITFSEGASININLCLVQGETAIPEFSGQILPLTIAIPVLLVIFIRRRSYGRT